MLFGFLKDLDPRLRSRRRQWKERIIQGGLFLCAFLSVITSFLIVVVLGKEAFPFFQEVSILEFLGTTWTPLLEPRSFGVLPLVCGTFLVVVGASMIVIPAGLSTAMYLSEYASSRTRSVLKPILEVLAGIPTVVYGYFALTFVTPILRVFIPSTQIFNAASAAIVVGIMVLPMVASLCDDALRAVPQTLRQGAYALGATHFEVTTRVVVPGSLSGIVASFVPVSYTHLKLPTILLV